MIKEFFSVNPHNEQIINSFPLMNLEEVENITGLVHNAYLANQRLSINNRSILVKRVGEILRERKKMLSELMTLEMGKPIIQSYAEVEKCAWLCDYYADSAEELLTNKIISTDAIKSYVKYLPQGIVFGIMPWNFPLWQVFRFVLPALLLGNGSLLKHAPNVCGCSLEIEKIICEAGFIENTFRSLIIDTDLVPGIIADKRICGVTFTGSTKAGRIVAGLAGQNAKKSVLELGGSDPYIVLSNADLDFAASECLKSKLINNGQSCIAAKRFIITKNNESEFTGLLADKLRNLKTGDPLNPDVELGPLARLDLRDNLLRQYTESINLGARTLIGGSIPFEKGYYFDMTILTDITPEMPVYREEVFGPLAPVIVAEDDEDAVRIANDTEYGLGAAIFTTDLEKGEKIAAERLNAGSCFVNAFVKSDPRLPFGGIKNSGYGRELGEPGLTEFANIKTVYVK